MNNIVIGIVGVIVAISVFLLLDSDETSNTNITPTSKVIQSEKKSEERVRDDDIKIEYTQTKEFNKNKEEKKEESKVVKKEEIDRYRYSEDVERVVSENSLSSIQTSNNDNITFKDKSGKYEAEIMVNNMTQRDTTMFPQIPILTTLTLPSGEVINAQIDPSLAKENDKIFIKVRDLKSGEDKIYNISSVTNLNSGEKANVNLGSQGTGESTEVKKHGDMILPPMPPTN